LTAGVGYLGAALPAPLARLLLRLKRAAGVRWNVGLD
jgi:hypothetical protein